MVHNEELQKITDASIKILGFQNSRIEEFESHQFFTSQGRTPESRIVILVHTYQHDVKKGLPATEKLAALKTYPKIKEREAWILNVPIDPDGISIKSDQMDLDVWTKVEIQEK